MILTRGIHRACDDDGARPQARRRALARAGARAPHRSDGRSRKPRGRSTFSCGALAIGGMGTLAARMLWRAHAPVLPPPPEFWAADLLLNCSGASRQQLVDNARWAATLKQRAVDWAGAEHQVVAAARRDAPVRDGAARRVAGQPHLERAPWMWRRALDRAAGVEWWLRIHGGREGLGFHHDSNWLDVRAGLNRSLAFPLCSSVFYLTDEGGPLVALRPRDTALRPTVVPAAAAAVGEYPALYKTLLSRIHAAQAAGKSDSLVSYPKFGKHVRFDGRVYHGGLGELAPPTSPTPTSGSRWSSPFGTTILASCGGTRGNSSKSRSRCTSTRRRAGPTRRPSPPARLRCPTRSRRAVGPTASPRTRRRSASAASTDGRATSGGSRRPTLSSPTERRVATRVTSRCACRRRHGGRRER